MMNPGIATAARGMGAGPVPGGIATPMMAQPMVAQPMMAGQPVAQPMAQPAVSQGLASAVAPFRGLPSKALLPIFAANPNFATLAALSEAQKQEQIAAQVRGQQAIEAAKQMQGSVAQDVVKKVASSGVGGQPYGFARGGIVAFQDGGSTAFPAEGQELQRLGMKYGIILSPYDSPQVRTQKIQRIRSMVEFDRNMEANRAEIPTEQSQATQQLLSQAYQDPSRLKDIYAAPKPAAPVARPAGAGPARPPAARPAGAGIGGAGAVTRPVRPPAATAGAAAPDDPYGLRAASADMFKTMREAGTVSDEEKQFRQALLEAMQAERQPPQEYKEPKGVSGRELLELAGSLNLEKGEGFGSLARGAAGILEKREAKKAEAMKANREIDAANRKLRTAVAQQRLAYATNNRQAQQAADAAVAKARYDLRVAEVNLGLESRKVGAQETAARRPVSGTSEESVDLKRMQAMRADGRYEGLSDRYADALKTLEVAPNNPRAQQRVRDAEAAINQLAQEYGVARMSPTSGQASAAPGATRLRFDSAGNPIP